METAQKQTDVQKTAPAGMAWISGRQKPFYNPRLIKKGKNKGKVKVTYLRSHNNYKTIIISPSSITKTLPPWEGYLWQQGELFQEA